MNKLLTGYHRSKARMLAASAARDFEAANWWAGVVRAYFDLIRAARARQQAVERAMAGYRRACRREFHANLEILAGDNSGSIVRRNWWRDVGTVYLEVAAGV